MSFSKQVVDKVWEKAIEVSVTNSTVKRKDKCGAWIKKSLHGSTGSFGWEIDHIKAVANNGSNELSNLQPLHWKNNRNKADGNYTPRSYCLVKANGTTICGPIII